MVSAVTIATIVRSESTFDAALARESFRGNLSPRARFQEITRTPDPESTRPTMATIAELPQTLTELLICPCCHSDIQELAGEMRCSNPGCSIAFPKVDDVPILLNEQQSLFEASLFLEHRPTFFKPVGRLRALVSGLLPAVSDNLAADRVLGQMRDLLVAEQERPRVLVLGGGILGAGMEQLASDPRIQLVETDVSLAERTQLICDGHHLPFRDATFDGVIVQAVLEHVLDPRRCVDEIERVLKERGLVYADTPFMQQVHGREFDFTRFTSLGHRRLMRNFTELRSGISGGPGAALVWALRYFVLSFFISTTARRVAGGVTRIAFGWLKYFDRFLQHRPGALDAASAFYFLGRKSKVPLDDRALIASYRGGF